jgi:hypothetical protein
MLRAIEITWIKNWKEQTIELSTHGITKERSWSRLSEWIKPKFVTEVENEWWKDLDANKW